MFFRNFETIYKIIFSHNPENTPYRRHELRRLSKAAVDERNMNMGHVCNDNDTCGMILTREHRTTRTEV